MENSPSSPQGVEEHRWSPQPAALAIAAAGGSVLAVIAVLMRSEPAGVFLTGLAALLLLGVAVAGFIARPRLSLLPADQGNHATLSFRSFLGRTYTFADAEIERVHVVRYPRWGRRVPMLEIEVAAPADRLIILSRWDLGAEPHDVIHTLARHGVNNVDIPREEA